MKTIIDIVINIIISALVQIPNTIVPFLLSNTKNTKQCTRNEKKNSYDKITHQAWNKVAIPWRQLLK